jgi:hypothetical protein
MSEHRKWAYFWSLFAQLVWVIAAIQFYFFAKIDLPGLQDIFGAHASYVLMISLPLVFIVLPYWLLKNPPAASDRPNSEPVSVEIYDKGKLPVLGRLIELTLLPETNSKNKKWVGFFYAADNDFFFLSSERHGGDVKRMGWPQIAKINDAADSAPICMEIDES